MHNDRQVRRTIGYLRHTYRQFGWELVRAADGHVGKAVPATGYARRNRAFAQAKQIILTHWTQYPFGKLTITPLCANS